MYNHVLEKKKSTTKTEDATITKMQPIIDKPHLHSRGENHPTQEPFTGKRAK